MYTTSSLATESVQFSKTTHFPRCCLRFAPPVTKFQPTFHYTDFTDVQLAAFFRKPSVIHICFSLFGTMPDKLRQRHSLFFTYIAFHRAAVSAQRTSPCTLYDTLTKRESELKFICRHCCRRFHLFAFSICATSAAERCQEPHWRASLHAAEQTATVVSSCRRPSYYVDSFLLMFSCVIRFCFFFFIGVGLRELTVFCALRCCLIGALLLRRFQPLSR